LGGKTGTEGPIRAAEALTRAFCSLDLANTDNDIALAFDCAQKRVKCR
jgi:hypothetical protein